MFRQNLKIVGFLLSVLIGPSALAATLSDIKFAELPGERAEVRLSFDSPPSTPTGYAIEQPARVVLDFAGVSNGLAEKKFQMSVGEVNSAIVVEGGGRTRLIVNLDNSVPYRSYSAGNEYVIEIGVESELASPTYQASSEPTSFVAQVSQPSASSSSNNTSARSNARGGNAIQDIDFRRGETGEGKVIISLSNSTANIDIEEVSSGVLVKLLNVSLPSELARKLDVVDFATPVNMISSQQKGAGTVIGIDTQGEYDYSAYQADNQYVVSVRPLTRQEQEEKKKEFAYTGDRLSLNFQNIPVRNVLQLIADFTKLNLVASDTVQGSITLRLENVPWDQALDIVLKTKGLDKRQIGNVLMVAPAAEIAERERQEIETQKQLQELAPLRTEYIRVRYANARELFALFVDSNSQGGGAGGGGGAAGGAQNRNSTGSILSERGQAIVDERTNSIILTDTEEKIEEFKRLVDQIDIPIRQVMIEARIVRANTDFRKELGSRITGAGANGRLGDGRVLEASGSMEGLFDGDGSPATAALFNNGVGGAIEQGNSTLVDLAAINPAGSFAIDLISSNFLLGLELSALQNSGFAEVVSQPKVITGDKQTASIQSGDEVGYQEESASGGTTTAFKEATLKLEVTPQITPDNKVIMDLSITQDSFSGVVNGIPTLAITQLETKVLVSDGETVVLGGIYSTETINSQTKVPLLGDIPFLGRLFRRDVNSSDKQELLLFITPKIMATDFVE